MNLAEKYRPDDFEEVVGQPTDTIESLLNGRETPNFLFHGPPGTGKTTTARLIAKELCGDPDYMLQLNASGDGRGIDPIKKAADSSRYLTPTGLGKVILLEEADGMTGEAQRSLKVPMEENPGVFILVTNHPGSIDPAIRSRCAGAKDDFEFGPVPIDAIVNRLATVARQEHQDIPRRRLEELARKADGDMRAALTLLEQEIRFGQSDGKDKAEAVEQYIEA